MSAQVAEDRDGTVKDADGALYAIIHNCTYGSMKGRAYPTRGVGDN